MVQQEHHGGLISVLTLRICSFQQTSTHIIQIKKISSSELKLKQTGLEESSESPWLYMLYNYHIDTKSRYKVTHREDKPLNVIVVKISIRIRNPSSHTVPNPKPPLSAQLVF